MANTVYNPNRDISAKYLDTCKSWINETGEVLVIIRYLCGGGARSYALIKSEEQLNQLISICPEGADIIVFKEPQLPYRGVCSQELIKDLLLKMQDIPEYLYVATDPENINDPRLFGEEGYTDKSLQEDLEEHFGKPIAVGSCPNYIIDDHNTMISASKGGIDGPR